MRVMALFSTSYFAKCLHVGEDGPGRGHLCHIDTFLVLFTFQKNLGFQVKAHDSHEMSVLLPWKYMIKIKIRMSSATILLNALRLSTLGENSSRRQESRL